MVEIVFESHATTIDNENNIASGINDAPLSNSGIKQAKELGQRYLTQNFHTIFCSDLQRSFKTAEIAFENRGFKIIQDLRLRECNYGSLNGAGKSEVDSVKGLYTENPFPAGESYAQTTQKMIEFLNEVAGNYESKRVMIIGSRATQYALENFINKIPLNQAILASWKWQPGWVYYLKI